MIEFEFIGISKDKNLYLAEAGYNRVSVFEVDGNFKFSFGLKGEGCSELNRSKAAKVFHNGNIYVSDLEKNRIQKLKVVDFK